MRRVRGDVVLPPDCERVTAGLVLVEVRDVSLQDAPSVVVAETHMDELPVGPGTRIPFELSVPDAEPGHTLSIRAHVSIDGEPAISHGDAISTVHLPIPGAGDVDTVEVPVRVV